MAGQIEAKLAELGITLPRPMQPIANYVPYVITGNLVVVSGQVPAIDGKIAITGKVSWGVSVDQAKEAARLCFINVLVHLKAACGGDLDRVRRVVLPREARWRDSSVTFMRALLPGVQKRSSRTSPPIAASEAMMSVSCGPM